LDRACIRLTRAYRFAAAHYYWDPARTVEENVRVFGKCANRNGHGHNYRVEVTLQGSPDPATGMLYDLAGLDRIVSEAILAPLDHRHLNLEVPFFAARQPTCENLALFAWETLGARLPAGLLERVRVHESDDLSAEVGPGSA
jgi:6-pyruvoyltetrahydropterin/6-carboxytetrahydropterin synthase